MTEELDHDNEEWLPSKIYLIDQTTELADAWSESFSKIPEVEVLKGDYFQKPSDAIVSPANSFGIMDGGLDLAIRGKLGVKVESKIQKVIVAEYHGELPIGCAEIIETEHDVWKYMISAPTMRIPESVEFTLNAYLAFRAILLSIENLNKSKGQRLIDSVVCSGLGTGFGRIPPSRCAGQMLLAYKSMLFAPTIGHFESIHEFHRDLLNA